ncbi:hypothetical protein GCM10012275_58170 [Longimycelium tulufanense]|uniref:Uncharacterized protein n=1 Tax=Longimycelium tulufanense TaxID=907463 RepID=A0A8J3FXI4_9PSEU|nr:hypothetical protein GCM10012275_58170 [Longimycelium tulufanense]
MLPGGVLISAEQAATAPVPVALLVLAEVSHELIADDCDPSHAHWMCAGGHATLAMQRYRAEN